MESVTATAASARPLAVRERPNSAIYYGLGVTEHSQGSAMVMESWRLAMARAMSVARVGISRCAPRTMQGSCDMGSAHEWLPPRL